MVSLSGNRDYAESMFEQSSVAPAAAQAPLGMARATKGRRTGAFTLPGLALALGRCFFGRYSLTALPTHEQLRGWAQMPAAFFWTTLLLSRKVLFLG